MHQIIAQIRLFNRFFTRLAGALDQHFLQTDATLPEARLLWEIGGADGIAAASLQERLGLDRAQVSRMLARLESRGLLARTQDPNDARARPIALTEAGRALLHIIDTRQHDAIAHRLAALDPVSARDLADALTRARLILAPQEEPAFTIRPPRPGEIGLIASRQSAIYAESNGWGRGLECVELETTGAFLRNFRDDRDQCFVADIAGVLAGAVFVTDEGDGISRLRLLHVEPFARRRGIAETLVRACIDQSRAIGQRSLILWTQADLQTARRIYARAGFVRVSEAEHHEFGVPVMGEMWTLDLAE